MVTDLLGVTGVLMVDLKQEVKSLYTQLCGVYYTFLTVGNNSTNAVLN